MNNKLGQLAFLSFLSAVPVFVFYDIGTRFAERGVNTGSAENNAAMYPRLVAILLAGLLTIQLFRTVRSRSDAEHPRAARIGAMFKTHKRAIAVFTIFLIYLWAFRWFGFLYSTPFFLALTQFALGVRNPLMVGAYALGVTAAVYYSFSELLNLALPAGDFFG